MPRAGGGGEEHVWKMNWWIIAFQLKHLFCSISDYWRINRGQEGCIENVKLVWFRSVFFILKVN